jgi:hypothetical protein
LYMLLFFLSIWNKISICCCFECIIWTVIFWCLKEINFSSVYQIFTKLGHMILRKWKNSIELKLSCGNHSVVKNYIYSNGDLDLWPNDPKINRVLPLPQGNHVAKFGKDPIYRIKVIVRKPVLDL